MPRRGLTTQAIVDEAARMVAEEGLGALSIRELAARLGVKPASLYNHIRGADDLESLLSVLALEQLTAALHADGDNEDAAGALRHLAAAYRSFAHANPELYKAIILAPRGDERVWAAERELIDQIDRAVRPRLPEAASRQNYVRALRSALHGFVSLEEAGFFTKEDPGPSESFNALVEGFITVLEEGKH